MRSSWRAAPRPWPPRRRRPPRTSWTVYHGSTTGGGVAAAVSSVTLSSRAWTSPTLDGQLYGEPLVSGGRIFVATENDTVYALSATDGTVEWSRHVGTPVPSGSLPCGNISPSVGITGTPVIDEARSELFVVADELVDGSPTHELVGTGHRHGQDGADPGRRPGRLDARRAAATHGPDARRRTRRLRLRRELRRLRVLPRVGDLGARGGRHPGGVRRRLRRWREPRRDLDGRCGAGGGCERQRLGHRRQRVGHVEQPPLRQQRLGARALVVVDPAAVLRPVGVGQQQRSRSGPLHRARTAGRRPGGGRRQVRPRLPARRCHAGRHRRPGGSRCRAPVPTTSTAGSPWSAPPSTCPA